MKPLSLMRLYAFKLSFVLWSILLFYGANAQQITLEQAIDTALSNNLTVRSASLVAEYQQKLIESNAIIPKTNISAATGQINSYYIDYQFDISQSIEFPKVYSNQKKLLQEEYTFAGLHQQLSKREIKMRVSQVFYNIILLKEKEQLLQRSDSLIMLFYEEEKVITREMDVFEKNSTDIQHSKLLLGLKEVHSQIGILEMKLKLLLNTNKDYEPVADGLKLPLIIDKNITSISEALIIQGQKQQKAIAEARLKLEESRLLPEISLGYSNITMKGSGSDDRIYDYSTRFHSVNIGLGIPIFRKGQKALIESEKVNVQIAENEYNRTYNKVNFEKERLLARYRTVLEKISFMEEYELPQTKLMEESAREKLHRGEIDYYEYVLIESDIIDIRSGYLDEIRNLNGLVLNLNFLCLPPESEG